MVQNPIKYGDFCGEYDFAAKFEYIRRFFQGLGALHAQDLVHSDIKPDNVIPSLQSGAISPTIIDCDSALLLGALPYSGKLKSNKAVKLTIDEAYAAPELLEFAATKKDRGHISGKADIYSAMTVIGKVMNGIEYSKLSGIERNQFDLLSEINDRAISDDPSLRPSAEQIVLGMENGSLSFSPPSETELVQIDWAVIKKTFEPTTLKPAPDKTKNEKLASSLSSINWGTVQDDESRAMPKGSSSSARTKPRASSRSPEPKKAIDQASALANISFSSKDVKEVEKTKDKPKKKRSSTTRTPKRTTKSVTPRAAPAKPVDKKIDDISISRTRSTSDHGLWEKLKNFFTNIYKYLKS